jgi:1-acyl-sn-glycerol-3-phosphate acyltransferase
VVIRPTGEQAALLRPWERLAFRFSDYINRDDSLTKRAANQFLSVVGLGWVHTCIRNLLVVEGNEHLDALAPPRGLLLVSNHRSFFDMYVVSCVLFKRVPQLIRRVYFPVRAEFFYDQPLGLLVNGVMSAWSMYPPVLRQPERSEFNKYTSARIVELLGLPGSVVGFHPEGTRNKTLDPYTLLPAQPGVGQLIMHSRPTVLPVFIHGLGNDLPRQIRSNFDGSGRKIIAAFGPPVDLARFYAMPARLRTYLELARHLRTVLTALGARERALRAELEPDRDPLGPPQPEQAAS